MASRLDFIVIAEALALALRVELGLRWMPPKTLIAHLGRTRLDDGWRPAAIDASRAARLVDRLSGFYPAKATCLKKSLILFRILRKRGLPAKLRIGVRKVDGQFNAHAWIECQGRVLLGGGIDHLYTALPLNS